MLPIHSIRDAILSALAAGNRLVLTAPTGSGKTTQVPQFLLHASLRSPQILVLQPRRLAARLVSERVARELDTKIGDLVGYQTRHDSRVSAHTRIRFMTEGLFLRLVHSNPALKDVGAVILDEFHERNLATDASIALVKLLQESSRPDLRMIVMSATLDTRLVSTYLSCPTLETHGRTFPVDIRYLDKRPTRRPVAGQWQRGPVEVPPWETAADALADLLDETEEKGDILIFMPGGHEIRRTIEHCQRLSTPQRPLSIFPLYSELPAAEQDAALSPAPHRKVIVSTNVAETSITIEGVRHVIDSGLARVNRFDPKRGLNTLSVEPISQSSADQRAGRAGRTAPGTATRLWLEREHRHRPAHETPEVRRLDLAEVILQLKSFGVGDVTRFPWLEPPDPAAVAHALELLTTLSALSPGDELTDTGRTMARLPMHPRLSRMLLEAARRNCLERATLWAALISERDILLRGAKHEFADDLAGEGPRSDFLVLEHAFAAARSLNFDPQRCAAKGLNGLACREVDKTRRLYADAARDARLTQSAHAVAPSALGCALLAAYPDHLAALRNPSNLACVMVRNRRGQLDPETVARRQGLVLPVEVREIGAGGSVKTVLSLVSEIELEWLYDVAADRIRQETVTVFNAETQAAETIDRELFEDLVISESVRHTPDPSAAATVLAEKVLDGTLKLETWDEAVEQWVARTRCVAEWFPERKLITYDEDDRRLIVEELCAGAVRYKDVRDKPVLPFVKGVLSWEDQRFIEQMAPERIGLPRGWRMPVEYTPGAAPRGRANIQHFYDLHETPTVAGGRVKVLLEILGPNFRPVQLTDDLAGFWQRLYPEIRKELSRRYPRHEWR